MNDRHLTLRDHRIGDIGWVIYRHALLYAEEYGWNEQFESLVAQGAGRFLKEFDPARERCWIAELDGAFAGSIFLVKDLERENTGKLRFFLVEPGARGIGLGRKLLQECVDFAKSAGYEKIVLWTNDVLHAARHLYEDFGFQLIFEEPIVLFGPEGMAQTWEKVLRNETAP
ncbi:MAG TPA: GNAT family N-acetyltransferase [Candidatus Kapabacteria bacterium]|nr:GNAT family N-acetyltransferase [Candidatus Kapabacteria bacterium]